MSSDFFRLDLPALMKIGFRHTPTWFRNVVYVLLVQLILCNISAAIYAYKLTHFYAEAGDWEVGREHNFLKRTWGLFRGPSFVKKTKEAPPPFSFDTVSLRTEDGFTLQGWTSNATEAKGTVCIFHGLTSNKQFYLPEAERFLAKGFNVLMVDFRGHGLSEGMQTSLGLNEALDVKAAVNYLQEKKEKNIYLFGGSMGAVSIARATAVYQLPVSGLIMELPFDGLLDHVKARGRSFGFPSSLFAYPVMSWMCIEQQTNFFRHRTSSYMSSIHCPVLLQFATNDQLVTNEEAENIWMHTVSADKHRVIYEDAGHSSLYRYDSVKWEEAIDSFLR